MRFLALPTIACAASLFCACAPVWAQGSVVPPPAGGPSVQEMINAPPSAGATRADPEVAADAPKNAAPEQGPHVTVDFRIDGLDEPMLTNAYNWLGYVAEDQRGRLDESRLKALHEAAPKSIEKALQPFGYYEPVIRAELRGGPVDYFARYHVTPGDPVRWSAIDLRVEGDGAALQALLLRDAPHVGRRIVHADYAAFKNRTLDRLHSAGYLDARLVKAELQVDVAAHSAVAFLQVDTGPHWRFGAVRFAGTRVIREDVLRRYVRIVPGESFDPQKLLDTQFALTDLDYFSDVEVTPERDAADGDAIPVVITLGKKHARRDDFGVGYGTDTGARVSAGTEFRRINESGDKLRVAVRASEKISGASSEYRIPIGVTPGEFLSFTASGEQDELSYGTSHDYRLGTALNRTLGSWKRIYYLRFHRSIFDFTAGDSRAVSVLTPGISLFRQWLDDPANTRRGLSIFLDTHGAQQGVLSDASFVQFHGLAKVALPLFRASRLLGRVEFGANAVKGFDQLPPDERFFAGGDQSVRGYGYQSIGAGLDGNGGVIGGRYLNVFSLEFETPVKGAWGAAVFGDAGGVGDSPLPQLQYGVGVGARYRAPFGSVQIDLAHPLEQGQPVVRLHLGVRVGL